LFQSIKAKPKKRCPNCGQSTARRLIGGGACVIFKGSGFYETDYRSDGYRKAAKAEAEASSGGADKKDASGKKTKVSTESTGGGDGGKSSKSSD
jgi:predicted nucleic acid-binding Zn ribbon protein